MVLVATSLLKYTIFYSVSEFISQGFSYFFASLQVKEIMSCAKKHLPSVLQNESHPYLQERDARDYCRINGIVFQVGTIFLVEV